jgi:hypothetical protein
MLDNLLEIGVLLLIAPAVSLSITKNNDYYDFGEHCINVMLMQAVISIVLILIGIGTLLKG